MKILSKYGLLLFLAIFAATSAYSIAEAQVEATAEETTKEEAASGEASEKEATAEEVTPEEE